MAELTRKDLQDAGLMGDKIDKLIGIIVGKANKARLDDNSFSLPSMLTVLRASTGQETDTFATAELSAFKKALFAESIPDDVVQEYLDICRSYERIIINIQTEAGGLPINNV